MGERRRKKKCQGLTSSGRGIDDGLPIAPITTGCREGHRFGTGHGRRKSRPRERVYEGKQIHLVVGSDTGGGYDACAKLLARHWPKYIPGSPSVLVRNMPGAGSLNAMNFVANVAPK